MGQHYEFQLMGEIVLAAVLGGIIGVEREASNKPAGFRTHVLVAAGAALLLGLSETLIEHFGRITDYTSLRADPVRIVEAIITGISFLGAGTIFRHKEGDSIEGLTTAASILFSAAIGMCVTLHLFVVAVGSTIFALLVLMASRLQNNGTKKKVK